MSRKRKSGCKAPQIEKIILATAILELIEILIEIIKELIE